MTHSHAHTAVGAAAAVARVRVQQVLGYGWPTAFSPCDSTTGFIMENANKRQPRRLGQRTT